MAEHGGRRQGDRGNNGQSGGRSLRDAVPGDELDELRSQAERLVAAAATRVMSGLGEKVDGLTDRLEGAAGKAAKAGKPALKAGSALVKGKSPVRAALSAGTQQLKDKLTPHGLTDKLGQLLGGNGDDGKGDADVKVTNIVEEIDIGAPVSVVYDTWTQFQTFPSFLKKVENVDQKDDTKLDFKAQILWSHRHWQAEIIDQIPDQRIVWRSSGPKGHVDGAVTFHELAPDLTRVLVVLEYYPQGLFERTGNLWRAQGRRVRLELKHFRRHVMTDTMLHSDELEGWRGRIEDGDVRDADEESEDDYDEDDYDEDDYGEDEEEDEEEDESDESDAEDDEDEEDEEEDESDAEDEGSEDYDDEDDYDEDDYEEDESDDEDDYDEDDEDDYDEDDYDEDEDEDESADERRPARGSRSRGTRR